MSAEAETRWLQNELDRYHDALRAVDYGFSAKEIARRVRSVETKLDALRHRVSDPKTVTWEQLGITGLHIDESAAYKRLPVYCHTEGFNPGQSKRALDLKIKVDLLRSQDPHRPHVALYSGTPFTNTILEAFVWQTYLQPDRLEEAGVASLDAWIANFVTMSTRVEPSPEGGTLRTITRPYEYRNVADLMGMFSEVAVLVDPATLPLQRPTKTGHVVEVGRTAQQAAYVAALAERADRIRAGRVPDDNMLLVCGNGRAAALDPALVGLEGGSPKLAAIIRQVADLYHAHAHDPIPGSTVPGALQLVFCDWGVPKPGNPSSYGTIRSGLIAAGVPADSIRWVHDATDDKAKAALFAACRDGRVAVLLASTDKAGLGTNIQTRLRHIHHADAPWRPADMEQREGRGLRHGNTYPCVDAWNYIVTGTFDAFMYAALARKAHIPAQLIAAATDPTIREVEELGDAEVSYSEIAAAASGNPLLLRRAELVSTIRRLRLLRSISTQELNTARRIVTENSRTIDHLNSIVTGIRAVAPTEPTANELRRFVQACQMAMRGTTRSSHGTWRGLTVEGHNNQTWETRPTEIALSVRSKGANLPVTTWARKMWNGDPTEIAHSLAQTLTGWLEALPAVAADALERITAATEARATAQHIVDRWVAPHTAELAEAEAALAELDGAITQAAA